MLMTYQTDFKKKAKFKISKDYVDVRENSWNNQ